jgi:hypothetical protein
MATGAGGPPAEGLDDWPTPSDRYLFYAASVATTLTLAMGAFIVVKGRGRAGYPIFKEKSVGLVCTHLLSGLCWLWASMVVEEHLTPRWLIHMRGSDFSLCVFWAQWMQMFLGWGLWMSCCFTRNYRLYKRDVKREEPVGFVIHLCVFNFPWFLLVLVDQILVSSRYDADEMPFEHHATHCMYSEVPWPVHALYLYMMFCLFFFVSMRARGYGNRFNDFFHVNTWMGTSAAVWAVLMFQIFTGSHFTEGGRWLKTTLILGLTFGFALRTNAVPIWKCLCGSMGYLDEFEDEYDLTDWEERDSLLQIARPAAAARPRPRPRTQRAARQQQQQQQQQQRRRGRQDWTSSGGGGEAPPRQQQEEEYDRAAVTASPGAAARVPAFTGSSSGGEGGSSTVRFSSDRAPPPAAAAHSRAPRFDATPPPPRPPRGGRPRPRLSRNGP